jgi:hypothetical protein
MNIDWKNITAWLHTALVVLSGAAAYIVANNLLPADSKAYAWVGLVLALSRLVKDGANPETWPQKPIVTEKKPDA